MDQPTKINVSAGKTVTDTSMGAEDQALAKSMERTAAMRRPNWFVIGVVAAVIMGVGSGYVVAAVTKAPEVLPLETAGETADSSTSAVKVGQVFGSKDAAAFKDSAEGVILVGGTDSEGSHHLVRAGGPSQNVYLTSSVMDLKMFENAKVKIYGETFKARKAGWLMDVGRVEVIELNAALPDWVVKEQQKTGAQGSDE